MNDTRKVILLTGATGAMGREAVGFIAAQRETLALRVLVRPEERSHPVVRDIQRKDLATIVWGDLTDPALVRQAVRGADVVLHVGALVSPLADRLPPALVHKVNVGGTQNIVDAIHAEGGAQRTRLVYIGTVAETGSRNAPVHWGRAGDPIKISAYDHYAVSKTLAEAVVAQSGLKYWVSLRQSGMAHFEMWKIFDPIMFHTPLNGVFEWSTAHDSGRLMAAVCGEAVPEAFWRGVYNIGGGAASRVVNHEFMRASLPQFQSILKPHWFATRNFHGQWYADSDVLEALVPFRQQTLSDYFALAPKHMPWLVRQAPKFLPGAVGKRIEKLARAPGGSLHWFQADETAKIAAHFGSRQAWEAIPRDWDHFAFDQPSKTPTLLNHGYDERRAPEDWTIADLRQAAEFRGGACLSRACHDPDTPVSWRASDGQVFSMTPRLYLKGGHWGPVRIGDPDADRREAQRNPFFAQVWSDVDG
ncbi:MAG TPA: NAD-dependent epimerase/dehydratase family protein [Caulobacter sp.]|nr:NAD-dependent epimerase/dehydratase family protein [Caulobacter sp.]